MSTSSSRVTRLGFFIRRRLPAELQHYFLSPRLHGGFVITLFDVYALWTVRSQLSHTPQLAHNIPFSPAMVVISALLGVAYVAYLARRS
jgi:hypothetical protein